MPTRSTWPRFSRCVRSESIGLGGASGPSISEADKGPTRATRTLSASTSRSGPMTPISSPAVFAGLPHKAFARVSATRSMAPAVGMPSAM